MRLPAIAVLLGGLLLTTSARSETLALYNWGDYINPEVLTRFTRDTGIEVTLDTYSSNEEMLAKIQAGASGYDIVFPSVWMQDIMLKLGLLERTGIGATAAFRSVIDPAFLRSSEDPASDYCMPYAWGTVGVFYNERVTGPLHSWSDFFAVPERTGGKIAMLDDMREVLAVGLITTGRSVNATDPAEVKAAADAIIARKDGIAAFTYESMGLLASGDLAAAQYFVGGTMFFKDVPDVRYMIPAEGATQYQEDICVLADAPHKAAARRFMEFYLRPEIAALNVSQQFNGTPNRPAQALTPAAIRDNPTITVPPETMRRLQIFRDLGPALRLYDRAWNAIRTAQ